MTLDHYLLLLQDKNKLPPTADKWIIQIFNYVCVFCSHCYLLQCFSSPFSSGSTEREGLESSYIMATWERKKELEKNSPETKWTCSSYRKSWIWAPTSSIISATILYPSFTQLSPLSSIVDGGKSSLSAVVLFRHVTVHSIDQILCRLQMLENCYWI